MLKWLLGVFYNLLTSNVGISNPLKLSMHAASNGLLLFSDYTAHHISGSSQEPIGCSNVSMLLGMIMKVNSKINQKSKLFINEPTGVSDVVTLTVVSPHIFAVLVMSHLFV